MQGARPGAGPGGGGAANRNEFSRLASLGGLVSSTGVSPAAVACPVPRSDGRAQPCRLPPVLRGIPRVPALRVCFGGGCSLGLPVLRGAGASSDSWAGDNASL